MEMLSTMMSPLMVWLSAVNSTCAPLLPLEPLVSLMFPVTSQFSRAMEFCPSITSASELLAVKVAFLMVTVAPSTRRAFSSSPVEGVGGAGVSAILGDGVGTVTLGYLAGAPISVTFPVTVVNSSVETVVVSAASLAETCAVPQAARDNAVAVEHKIQSDSFISFFLSKVCCFSVVKRIVAPHPKACLKTGKNLQILISSAFPPIL